MTAGKKKNEWRVPGVTGYSGFSRSIIVTVLALRDHLDPTGFALAPKALQFNGGISVGKYVFAFPIYF